MGKSQFETERNIFGLCSVVDSKANQGSVLRLIQIMAQYNMDVVSNLSPTGNLPYAGLQGQSCLL